MRWDPKLGQLFTGPPLVALAACSFLVWRLVRRMLCVPDLDLGIDSRIMQQISSKRSRAAVNLSSVCPVLDESRPAIVAFRLSEERVLTILRKKIMCAMLASMASAIGSAGLIALYVLSHQTFASHFHFIHQIIFVFVIGHYLVGIVEDIVTRRYIGMGFKLSRYLRQRIPCIKSSQVVLVMYILHYLVAISGLTYSIVCSKMACLGIIFLLSQVAWLPLHYREMCVAANEPYDWMHNRDQVNRFWRFEVSLFILLRFPFSLCWVITTCTGVSSQNDLVLFIDYSNLGDAIIYHASGCFLTLSNMAMMKLMVQWWNYDFAKAQRMNAISLTCEKIETNRAVRTEAAQKSARSLLRVPTRLAPARPRSSWSKTPTDRTNYETRKRVSNRFLKTFSLSNSGRFSLPISGRFRLQRSVTKAFTSDAYGMDFTESVDRASAGTDMPELPPHSPLARLDEFEEKNEWSEDGESSSSAGQDKSIQQLDVTPPEKNALNESNAAILRMLQSTHKEQEVIVPRSVQLPRSARQTE